MVETPPQRNLWSYDSAGLEFAVTFGLMLAAGFYLDRALKTGVGFTLLGGAVGFAVALYHLLRKARAARAERQHDDRSDTE